MHALLARRSATVSNSENIGPSGGPRAAIRPSSTVQRVAVCQPESGKAAAPETARRARFGARLVRALGTVCLILLGTFGNALPAQSQATTPSAPQSLSATPTDRRIELRWGAPADNGGSAILRYELRYAEGASVPGNKAWTSMELGRAGAFSSLTNGTSYSFEVRAVNGSGAGPAAQIQATPTSVPAAPRIRNATPYASRLVLRWSAPENAGTSAISRYEVRHAEGATVPQNTTWYSAGLQTTFNFTNLSNRMLHTFEVRAVNGHSRGPAAQFQAHPGGRPTAPRTLAAAQGDSQVVLRWGAPTDNGGYDISRYEVRHAEGASVPSDTAWVPVGLVTTYTVTGLSNGALHSFEVRAVNPYGAGSAVQTQATPATMPAAPRIFNATPGNGRVELKWSAPENAGTSAILRYEVRHAAGASVPDDRAWTSAGLAKRHIVYSLRNGTRYSFEVRAVNGRGPGAAAQIQATPAQIILNGPPAAPANVSATAGDAQVVLRWMEPSHVGGSEIVRYEVRHAEGASLPTDTAWTSVGLVSTYTISSLAGSKLHTFEVRAVNRQGAGPAVQILSTPRNGPPAAPQNVSASPSTGRVVLRWEAPAIDGGSDILRYEVRHAAGASVPENVPWIPIGLGTAGSFANLINGTQYSFEVRAVNAQGAGQAARVQVTVKDERGVEVSPTALTVPEGEGRTYTVVLGSQPTGTVTVIPSVTGSADVTVSGSLSFTTENWNRAQTVTVEAAEDADAANDAATVSHAVSGGGYGSVTASAVAVTVPDDEGVPSAPRRLSATPGGGRVTLTWEVPADNGGSDPVRFELRHAEGTSVPVNRAWTTVNLVTTHTVTRLTGGRLRTFEVRAVNRWGAGPAAQVQATPGDSPTVSVRAERATVTEGADAEFRISRTGSTAESLSVGVDISGHKKIMSAATRTLVENTGPSPDTTVTFAAGVSEVTLRLTSEADLVNEGDGEISVTIPGSLEYQVGGTGNATVLVEDDDIPEVTLRWISPAMTLQNNVWVGSMVEGQDVEFGVECSGNTLAPDGITGRIPVRRQELLNHPKSTDYNVDWTSRYACDRTYRQNGRRRYVGPDNGRIEVDLLQQVLSLDSLPGDTSNSNRTCYGSPDDVRFCPKFALGAVTSARIEVLNRNPTITVEALDDEVNEGEPARFRLTRIWTSDWLNSQLLDAASTTIDFTTATVGDYVMSPPSGKKTFAASITEIIVEIPTVRDGAPGEDGLVTFKLTPGGPETQSGNLGGHYEVYDHLDGITPPGGSSRVASVQIRNIDDTGIEVSATALPVPEGDSRSYTVVLGSQPAGPVTVTPSVAGSADVTVSGALTFTAQNWNRAQTVTVSAAQDADAANDAATVSHAVSGGGYSSVTVPDVTVTVEDDDEQGVRTSATALTVPEGDSRTYTVVLGSQPAGPVTVTPSVAGSADVTVSGALTFTAQNWNRAQTVTVSAAQDADAANDAATVSHAVSGGGYGSVTVPDVTVTVEDDDEQGVRTSATALTVPEGDSRTYTVVLGSQPAGPVTVTPSVAGSADVTVSGALTFTAQNWDQAQTVTVSAAQDADAANDAATVSHAVSGGGYGSVTVPDVTVKVEDDDEQGVRTSATALTVPEGDSRTYTVMLRSQPAGPVTVTPSVAGSADVTVSGALTFTAQNWNQAQTVTVSAAQDADAANDAATVSHAVSGGGYGSVTVPDVEVTVSDDETASVSVALTVSPSSVDEAAGATAITVTGTLNGAARNSDTAVTVTVSAGTASTGDFAAVQDFTLTITAGQISGTATFRLTPVDDTIDEDDETVRVAGTVQGLTVTAGTVTVEDDDEQGVRTSATALTVPEGDSRTYTVALRSQPAGPVTVTPSVAGSADVTVSGALTFTAQNWNQAQTVTVSAAQDADAANDAATVSHAVSGGGYGSVTVPDVAHGDGRRTTMNRASGRRRGERRRDGRRRR